MCFGICFIAQNRHCQKHDNHLLRIAIPRQEICVIMSGQKILISGTTVFAVPASHNLQLCGVSGPTWMKIFEINKTAKLETGVKSLIIFSIFAVSNWEPQISLKFIKFIKRFLIGFATQDSTAVGFVWVLLHREHRGWSRGRHRGWSRGTHRGRHMELCVFIQRQTGANV